MTKLSFPFALILEREIENKLEWKLITGYLFHSSFLGLVCRVNAVEDLFGQVGNGHIVVPAPVFARSPIVKAHGPLLCNRLAVVRLVGDSASWEVLQSCVAKLLRHDLDTT